MYSNCCRSRPACWSACCRASPAASSTFTPLRARPLPRTRGKPRSSSSTTALVKLVPQSMPASNGMVAPPNAGFEALVEFFQSKQGGADGADKLRIGADLHLASQYFLEGAHHTDIAGYAAGHGDLGLDVETARQRERAFGNGKMNATEDVFRRLALRQVGKNVGLDKDRTNGGDPDRILRLERERSDLVEADAHDLRRIREEASGAGGALVIHDEIDYLAARPDADGFGILPAHINHRPRARAEKGGALGMTGDLGHLGVAESDLVAAVPGADNEADVARVQGGLLAALVEGAFGRTLHVGAGIHQGARQYVHAPVVGHDDCLGLGGADIDSGCDSHVVLSLCADADRSRGLGVLQRLEESVDTGPGLGFPKVAGIFQVGLDVERGHAQLLGEVIAHVALAGGEQAAALHKVDHEAVGVPLLNVAAELFVALQKAPVGYVLLNHVHGHRFEGMVGVVTETEFPQPADGRIGGGHGTRLPLGEHIAEGAEIRIGGRAFHHQAEVFFLVNAVA